MKGLRNLQVIALTVGMTKNSAIPKPRFTSMAVTYLLRGFLHWKDANQAEGAEGEGKERSVPARAPGRESHNASCTIVFGPLAHDN